MMEVKYKGMLAAGGQLAGMAYLISGCCAGFIPE